MSKVQSALGDFLGRALLQAQGRPKGLSNELQGWTEIDFDLPSLHDVEELYRKSAYLAKGTPHDYLLPIAMGVEGFRGHTDFEIDQKPHCGFHFFRNEASFFLVFRVGTKRTAKLYHMGRSTGSDERFKAACSKLALNFDSLLQQFYFSFQTNLLQGPGDS